MYKVKMFVSYKDGVFDPAGAAVGTALHSLGYENTADVSIGKYLTFNIEADGEDQVAEQIKEMAKKLLTNPIIEKYTYELEKA